MSERGEAARARWGKVISEQTASGQSVAAFCRDPGLHGPQFFFWKKKLSEAAEPSFLQAVVTDQQAVSASVACVGIEVRLRGGCSLLVEPGFDAGHLRALLAVLEPGS